MTKRTKKVGGTWNRILGIFFPQEVVEELKEEGELLKVLVLVLGS